MQAFIDPIEKWYSELIGYDTEKGYTGKDGTYPKKDYHVSLAELIEAYEDSAKSEEKPKVELSPTTGSGLSDEEFKRLKYDIESRLMQGSEAGRTRR